MLLAEFKIGGEQRQVVRDDLLELVNKIQEVCDQGIILDPLINYGYILSEFGILELQTVEGIYISIVDLVFCLSSKLLNNI